MDSSKTESEESSSRDYGAADLKILTQTIEDVTRKLARLLIGRISLPKLEELVRVIFIQEARDGLQSENPGKAVSLSTLSVLTGVDTRVLSKALKDFNDDEPVYEQANLLAEITPECTVLDAWHSRAEFQDARTGAPKILSVKGEQDSFEQLVRECLPKRGLTAKSMLRRLVDSGNVKHSQEQDRVVLIDEQYSPFRSQDETATLEVGLAAVASLLGTLNHNVKAVLVDAGKTHYQRGCWTHRVPAEKQAELKQALSDLLAKSDRDAREIISRFEETSERTQQVTSGVSMFYFEEKREREETLAPVDPKKDPE